MIERALGAMDGPCVREVRNVRLYATERERKSWREGCGGSIIMLWDVCRGVRRYQSRQRRTTDEDEDAEAAAA